MPFHRGGSHFIGVTIFRKLLSHRKDIKIYYELLKEKLFVNYIAMKMLFLISNPICFE